MANKNGFFKLELLILSILDNGDSYGYQITTKIKQITDNTIVIKDGTLYPILLNLLKKEYVTTYEEKVGKKIRAYYHLEPLGKEVLEEMISEFNKTVKYIDKIIQYKGDEKDE